MTKKAKIYVSAVFVVFTLIILLQHLAPTPPNWDANYDRTNKEPYGCKVTRDMMPLIFPNEKINDNKNTLYISLKNYDKVNTNLIVITKNFAPDALDFEQLFEYVANGNNAFISALSFSDKVKDSLGFEVDVETSIYSNILKDQISNLQLNLSNNKLVDYEFPKEIPKVYFDTLNISNSKAIGYYRKDKPNYIKVRYGMGTFFLHTTPWALTNYHILYGNHKYASHVFSYLPIAETTWDEYYKPNNVYNTTPVRYILSEAPLKAAYFITIISILLYLIFGGKRKQQIIPIIKPLQNDSLLFAQTIGRLYYKKGNSSDLANKKIKYFNDFLKQKYNTTIPKNDSEMNWLATKSGVDIELIEILVQHINYIKTKNNISSDSLVRVFKIIEEFKSKCI